MLFIFLNLSTDLKKYLLINLICGNIMTKNAQKKMFLNDNFIHFCPFDVINSITHIIKWHMVTPEDHNIRSPSSKQMEMVTKRICKTELQREVNILLIQ